MLPTRIEGVKYELWLSSRRSLCTHPQHWHLRSEGRQVAACLWRSALSSNTRQVLRRADPVGNRGDVVGLRFRAISICSERVSLLGVRPSRSLARWSSVATCSRSRMRSLTRKRRRAGRQSPKCWNVAPGRQYAWNPVSGYGPGRKDRERQVLNLSRFPFAARSVTGSLWTGKRDWPAPCRKEECDPKEKSLLRQMPALPQVLELAPGTSHQDADPARDLPFRIDRSLRRNGGVLWIRFRTTGS